MYSPNYKMRKRNRYLKREKVKRNTHLSSLRLKITLFPPHTSMTNPQPTYD